MLNTLSLLVLNQPGVITKISTAFSGRGLNIEEMTARVSEQRQYTRIVVGCLGEHEKLRLVRAQLEKMEVVKEISLLSS